MSEPRKNPLIDDLRRGVSKSLQIAFPTNGQFYHEGVVRPGADYTSITINPMTISAELVLRDTILMTAGRAIPRMIEMLVPEVLEPEELSDIDVEVILLAVRIASYGAVISIDHKCENPQTLGDIALSKPDSTAEEKANQNLVCEAVNPLRINLIDHIQKFPVITDWSPYRIEFEIDKGSKQVVHLRRMPYKTVLNNIRYSLSAERDLEPFKDKTFDQLILDDTSLRAYERLTESTAEANLGTVLDAINAVEMVKGEESRIIYAHADEDSTTMVRDWLWSIPSEWVATLNQRIAEFSKDIGDKNTINYECPHCKYKNSLQLQLDVNKLFFSKPPVSEPTNAVSETSTAPTRSKPRVRSRISSRSHAVPTEPSRTTS